MRIMLNFLNFKYGGLLVKIATLKLTLVNYLLTHFLVQLLSTLSAHHWSSRRETYWECTNQKNMESALVVYYQERDGPVNYEEGNSTHSTVTLETSNNEYDYPLVTVEISTGKVMPYNTL